MGRVTLKVVREMKLLGDALRNEAKKCKKSDLRTYVSQLLLAVACYQHAASFDDLCNLAKRSSSPVDDSSFMTGLELFYSRSVVHSYKLAAQQFTRCDDTHGYAMYMRLAILLKTRGNFGAVQDEATCLLLGAVANGCPHAYLTMGKAYLGEEACKVVLPRNYRLGAVNFLFGSAGGISECSFKLKRLKKRFAAEIASFGKHWSPSTHSLLPENVQLAMEQWMLVATHGGMLPKGVISLILSYIVTEDGW